MQKKPLLLIILDGFGHSEDTTYNAIFHARTPHLDTWFNTYPHCLLHASGEHVGLLPGTIGTSEVGHLTIGAGRVINESITRIHDLINKGTFAHNQALVSCIEHVQKQHGRLHLLGLLSDAGVHSHEDHLYAFLDAALASGLEIYVHPFLDGRDTPPKSAIAYLDRLQQFCKTHPQVHIGTIQGRFYAMDRDTNWQRTEQAYHALTRPQQLHPDWKVVITNYYNKGITDEFIPPFQCTRALIQPHDGLIFFNFRADRARQLTRCFTSPYTIACAQYIPLSIVTMTEYEPTDHAHVFLTKEPVVNTLKHVVSAHHKTLFCIAETEKYAHVTYFFGGGSEKKLLGETWVLIPSIKTKNYADHPHMSAHEITDAIIHSLNNDPADLYIINYANADMVAHSGDFQATIAAVEYLDQELKRLYDVVLSMDGTLCITADHGNAEQLFDEAIGQPRTSHTTNKVPFLFIKNGAHTPLHLDELADIAPFILKEMYIPIPHEMLIRHTAKK